ncbi:unnamed protein product, partial [Ectocarpus sp. 13 AM-2016]
SRYKTPGSPRERLWAPESKGIPYILDRASRLDSLQSCISDAFCCGECTRSLNFESESSSTTQKEARPSQQLTDGRCDSCEYSSIPYMAQQTTHGITNHNPGPT